jgi:pyrroline-5-carboxylate reductase
MSLLHRFDSLEKLATNTDLQALAGATITAYRPGGVVASTSSGPAFVALMAEAMADGAVAAGLPRQLAQHLAHRTLAGTAALLDQQALHPGQLKDMVTSPGGTTIAGLRQLERAGLRSALLEAVLAAAERSRQLA